MKDEKLISVTEAAAMLNCSRAKLYALNRTGKIKLVKIKNRAMVAESAIRKVLLQAEFQRKLGEHQRLRPDEAAVYIGVPFRMMYDMRASGTGPPFIRLGKTILYDTREIDSWMEENTFKSVAEQQASGKPKRVKV